MGWKGCRTLRSLKVALVPGDLCIHDSDRSIDQYFSLYGNDEMHHWHARSVSITMEWISCRLGPRLIQQISFIAE